MVCANCFFAALNRNCSLTSICWIQPRRSSPIPLRGLFYYHMTISHGHRTPAVIVAEFRSAPVGVDRIDDQRIRLSSCRIIEYKSTGFLRRLRGDTKVWVSGVDWPRTAVSQKNRARGIANGGQTRQRIIRCRPDSRPVAAPNLKIEGVIGKCRIRWRAGIVRFNNGVCLEPKCRTKQ